MISSVLITGGAGFVGRHFVRRLLDEGKVVTVVDNLCAGRHPEVDGFDKNPRFFFDNRDCREFFKTETSDEFDLIIHCAAIVGGRLKIENAPLDVATDLAIDADFFRWCINRKPPGFMPLVVYFSSSAVYPVELQTKQNCPLLAESLTIPGVQSRIGMPDSTYGWSKLSGEVLAHHAVKTYGLPVKIYRPFGGYGEDQSFDYPFPSIIRRIVNGENPVTVWGSGEQYRDFIHIDLIVDIVLDTMNRLKPGETLNLGTGLGMSFKDLARLASEVLGIPISIINDASKPEGVFSRVADPYKLKDIYDMPDPMVRLKEGIKKVAAAVLDGTKTP